MDLFFGDRRGSHRPSTIVHHPKKEKKKVRFIFSPVREKKSFCACRSAAVALDFLPFNPFSCTSKEVAFKIVSCCVTYRKKSKQRKKNSKLYDVKKEK
jgi:hypothetical protein